MPSLENERVRLPSAFTVIPFNAPDIVARVLREARQRKGATPPETAGTVDKKVNPRETK